ncbi:MerR family transcriptional regulator [Streptomyces sp. CBMA152]|uniref:MerR family transcriptional regulator n=1 Tax=Streptomyces sp. CBMA152 TaxID=1896312 RepID=UPI001660078E|nr:MerR family transcriptional regulator [Streptomyces sp. CBMA152]MBD0747058.1 MerR family transcriptional regulator [Streptomyces sp. CBMA152]
MRIGEIAALVGVTPRAVRHYHHVGLLPEPARRANGYREYGVRDAVALARIRRLTELGLGLDEVRDVIADDAGRELAEVLGELDADLAGQEAGIRARRARLAGILARADQGPLPADAPLSPELADVFGRLETGPESPLAVRDRELVALLDTVAEPGERERLLGAVRAVAEEPGAVERAREVYALLDALADADPADPRVPEAARALAACLPPDPTGTAAPADSDGHPFLRAFLADLAPAQAAAVRQAMRLWAEGTA